MNHINERQDELTALHQERRPEPLPRPIVVSPPTDLADNELIALAANAKNGHEFSLLWEGSWAGYPSQSEADLALCTMLAFYTGNDEARKDRLFRLSGLMRDKWDERRGSQTYGELTLKKSQATQVYTGRLDIPVEFPPAIEETLRKIQQPQKSGPSKPTIGRICDLQREELPPTKWAIEPILPEGLTILGGKPKLGKSWLALALLHAISSGGVALNAYPVEQGEVLYLALEDGKKRLQKRTNKMLDQAIANPDFYYATTWPRLSEGGLTLLREWIKAHPRARMICIDTWGQFKPKGNRRSWSQHDDEYDELTPLQQLAQECGIAIVVVDHMRKLDSEDPLDMVTGSTGKTGAVDGFLLLYRKRGETEARLFVLGRDIEEETELPLIFNQECASWIVQEEEAEMAAKPQQQELLTLLSQYPQGLSCNEIAELVHKKQQTVRNLLGKLKAIKKVRLQHGVFKVSEGAVKAVKKQHSEQATGRSTWQKNEAVNGQRDGQLGSQNGAKGQLDFPSDHPQITAPSTANCPRNYPLTVAKKSEVDQPVGLPEGGDTTALTAPSDTFENGDVDDRPVVRAPITPQVPKRPCFICETENWQWAEEEQKARCLTCRPEKGYAV